VRHGLLQVRGDAQETGMTEMIFMKLSLKIKMGSDGNFAAVSEEPQATVDPEVRAEPG